MHCKLVLANIEREVQRMHMLTHLVMYYGEHLEQQDSVCVINTS